MWESRLYRGKDLPVGYRLVGDGTSPQSNYDHYIGGDGNRIARCPGCESLMLAAWDLNWEDGRLRIIFPWRHSRLTVFVCPNCDLYQDPYWVVFGAEIKIISSAKITREPYLSISKPYYRRFCHLQELSDADYPTTEYRLRDLLCRNVRPAIYHQIGGLPIMRGPTRMDCCCCKQEMRFSGIVDSDEINYVLLDDGNWKTSLLFGDLGYLDVFTCAECVVVGVKFSIG